jgi:hypothetical protein
MATMIDLPTNRNLEPLRSNSNEPSSTIRIKPMVPITGRTGVRSGIEILKKVVPCFTNHPKVSNNIMDGILVFDEVISKK